MKENLFFDEYHLKVSIAEPSVSTLISHGSTSSKVGRKSAWTVETRFIDPKSKFVASFYEKWKKNLFVLSGSPEEDKVAHKGIH